MYSHIPKVNLKNCRVSLVLLKKKILFIIEHNGDVSPENYKALFLLAVLTTVFHDLSLFFLDIFPVNSGVRRF